MVDGQAVDTPVNKLDMLVLLQCFYSVKLTVFFFSFKLVFIKLGSYIIRKYDQDVRQLIVESIFCNIVNLIYG